MNARPSRPSSASRPRLMPNAWHAFGGVWRLTARRFISPLFLLQFAGLLAVLALLMVTLFQRQDTKFYTQWVANFYLVFLAPILAFLSGAGAMRDEMKAEAIDYVLTRPIRRPAALLFKFLSHLACIQMGYMLALAVVIGVGVYRQIPTVWTILPWALLAQVCIVTVFAAFGFFAAVLTSRYMIIGLLYGAIIEFAIGNIPTQLNALSMTRHLRHLLHPVLVAIDPKLVAEQSAAASLGAMAVFTVGVLAAAAGVFSQLEMAGARPSET